MDMETFRSLFGYHRWVTERLLADAERLPHEQTRQSFGASFDSIHGTAVHLLGAERTWYSRWTGEPPIATRAEDYPDVATVHGAWLQQQRRLDEFLDGLTAARLDQELRWTNSAGLAFELPLWQTLLQVVNHGTHHRAELADMLTRAGRPPEPTDLIVYYREQTEARRRA